jgi:hypothetical protein
MRAILLIVIVAIIVIIGSIASGFVDVRQIRAGSAPSIIATRNAVTAKGGQAPAFDVETGSVKVGTKETNVQMPTVEIQKPGQPQTRARLNNSV